MLPQSAVRQILSSAPNIAQNIAPSETPLDYLKRILPHVDHRGNERESPFQIDKRVSLIAYWTEGGTFVRHPQSPQVVVDVEQLFAQLAGKQPPLRNAWQAFKSRNPGQPGCWTPYFGIRLGRNGDLELTFTGRGRDPELMKKVNALIEQEWPILKQLEPVSFALKSN